MWIQLDGTGIMHSHYESKEARVFVIEQARRNMFDIIREAVETVVKRWSKVKEFAVG